MSISVSNLHDLRLLVECIDINLISTSVENADGWGTAGIIIKDAANALPNVMPMSGPGKPGTIIDQSGDRVIVTQDPKAFVWFTAIILSSNIQSPNSVPYFEQLPQIHLAYCALKMFDYNYDIKDELLYICDRLIEGDEKNQEAE